MVEWIFCRLNNYSGILTVAVSNMWMLLFCLLQRPLVNSQANYTGHSVLRALPTNDLHLKLLHELNKNETNVDFWKPPTRHLEHVDIRLSQSVLRHTQDLFSQAGMTHHVMIKDVQNLIDNQRRKRRSAEVIPWADDIRSLTDSYHSFEEILTWLNVVATSCGSQCHMQEIGETSEKRPLMLFKITTDEDLPAVWIDGGIHAREWISPATVLYLIERLVGGIKGTDPVARELISKYSWYILPVANPDGYVYSYTEDRMWRKTRSINPNSPCRGTDPNRNWNFYWGGHGTSSDPCAENYRGSYPFSEPEPRFMANYIWPLRHKLLLYLSFHSYGQFWLLPWGFSYLVPSDYSDLVAIGNEAIRMLSQKHGIRYRIGTASRLLYRAAGGSDDWIKGRAGVKYSYTIELGDTGQHGFLLPAEHIPSTGTSMFDAVNTLLTNIEQSQG